MARRRRLLSLLPFLLHGGLALQPCSRGNRRYSLKLLATSDRRSSSQSDDGGDDASCPPPCQQRRQYLITISAFLPSAVLAADPDEPLLAPPDRGGKPYTPLLDNLLPAVRVKLVIDRAAEIATSIPKTSGDDQSLQIDQLCNLILEPRQFLTPQESETSKTYIKLATLNEWTNARQKEAASRLEMEGITSINPVTRLNEGFEQWGERRQFRRLRRQQQALEQSNAMRAAFNAYTNNLVFGESYVLTATKDEKKRMIRQYNQLPDVTSVIRSDLDLRDLYRNQVLTAMDDAKAELQYQLQQPQFDGAELATLLSEAKASCDKWFGFVPEVDIKAALDKVAQDE